MRAASRAEKQELEMGDEEPPLSSPLALQHFNSPGTRVRGIRIVDCRKRDPLKDDLLW